MKNFCWNKIDFKIDYKTFDIIFELLESIQIILFINLYPINLKLFFYLIASELIFSKPWYFIIS